MGRAADRDGRLPAAQRRSSQRQQLGRFCQNLWKLVGLRILKWLVTGIAAWAGAIARLCWRALQRACWACRSWNQPPPNPATTQMSARRRKSHGSRPRFPSWIPSSRNWTRRSGSSGRRTTPRSRASERWPPMPAQSGASSAPHSPWSSRG